MMMTKQAGLALGLVGMMALGACQTEDVEVPLADLAGRCDVTAFEGLVGQPAAAAQTTGYDGPVRVLGARDMMTMDLNFDRLTIVLDEAGQTIRSVSCT